VYLAAGHDGWLDTWEVLAPLSVGPRFAKVAKAEYGDSQANTTDQLYEGMTIQQVDADSLDVWMAPHDFGGCGDGSGRECARAIYQCRVDF
jgi:hypothetical protein